MIPVDKCKAILNDHGYTQEQVESLRDELYLLARFEIDDFLAQKRAKKNMDSNPAPEQKGGDVKDNGVGRAGSDDAAPKIK